MNAINTSRVIMGGLAAGLVINCSEFVMNLVVFEAGWRQAMSSLHVSMAGSVAVLAGFNLCGFLGGIVTVWLYAAIRPRYGSGMRTAAIAGFAVWILGYLLAASYAVLMGIISVSHAEAILLWGLPEILAASIAGARLYRERDEEEESNYLTTAAGR